MSGKMSPKRIGTAVATGGLSEVYKGGKDALGRLMKTPTGPNYNMDQAVMKENIGVQSDLGNVGIIKNADGSYSKRYTMSDADKQRQGLIQGGLSGLSLDPTKAQDAYYNQATRLLNPQFDRQKQSLDESLINRGIQVGNKQYSDTMGDLQNQQAGTLSDIANQSVFKGQDLIGSQIGNINQLSGGRDIGALAGMGGSSDAYNNKMQAEIAAADRKAAGKNALIGAIGNAGGSAAALLSDIRAKENLHPVGKLYNGLTVYIGNYKEETGLSITPQLFLIAQDVKEVNPEAVFDGDLLMVDYAKAVQ